METLVQLKRPAIGKIGRPTTVHTNHYELRFKPDTSLLQYDVLFTPQPGQVAEGTVVTPREPKKEELMRVWKKMIELKLIPRNTMYDGSRMCFSQEKLSQEPISVALDSLRKGRRPSQYRVVMTEVALVQFSKLNDYLDKKIKMDGDVLTVIQAVNVALGQLSRMELLTFGKLIFGPHSSHHKISGGLEIRGGIFQTLSIGEGITVNMDIAYTPFLVQDNLLTFIKEVSEGAIDGRQPLIPQSYQRLRRLLQNIDVTVEHLGPNRKYKIRGISKNGADKEFFDIRQEREGEAVQISVANYYATKKNMPLQNPRAHCADLGKAGMIPLELLSVAPDTKHKGVLNERQTSAIIQVAAKKPAERLRTIQSAIQSTLQFSNDPYLSNLGIRVNKDPISVTGRMLPPPQLLYGSGRVVTPNGGVWNLANTSVFQGLEIASLGVAIIRGSSPRARSMNERDASAFIDRFARFSSRMGVVIQSSVTNRCPIATIQHGESIEQALRKLFEDARNVFRLDPQILIVLLPDANSTTYAEVKRAGDVVLGVSTQCLQVQKILNAKDGYLANVALKVNVKCPGLASSDRNATPESRHVFYNARIPTRSPMLSCPTMVVGLDVDHPGPGSSQPSIAAMVGSMDPSAVRYSSISMALPERGEIVGEVAKVMMVELIERFKRVTKLVPERILFYRDGVSDGEMAQVQAKEISALHSAFAEQGIKPKLTFIVVKKRHHTRFFPGQDSSDRTGNLRPGFVLDTKITSNDTYDFFLQSQAGIQGTSKPAHYTVLVDEINASVDDLQQFTFELCHTQQRCTRAIGMVAPIFYADLLCTRARSYLRASDDSDSLSLGGQAYGQVNLPMVHESIRQFMYFV